MATPFTSRYLTARLPGPVRKVEGAAPEAALFEASFARFYRTAEHADLTVKCGPYHFKLHKIVVGALPGYFKAACAPAGFRESFTNLIELPADGSGAQDGSGVFERDFSTGDDPDVLKTMMYFFYHMSYDTPAKYVFCTNPQPRIVHPPGGTTFDKAFDNGDTVLVIHANLFAMALKYQVPSLEAVAERSFIFTFDAIIKSKLPDGMAASLLAPAIYVVYCSTPEHVRALRDPVVRALGSPLGLSLLLAQSMLDAVANLPELGAELLKRAIERELTHVQRRETMLSEPDLT